MSKVVDQWINLPADPAHRLPIVVALWRGHRRLKSCSRMSEAKNIVAFENYIPRHSTYLPIRVKKIYLLLQDDCIHTRRWESPKSAN